MTLIADWIPDVAILDAGLPQMNGVELATLMRRRCPGCDILLFPGPPESGELVDEAGKTGETFEIAAKRSILNFFWTGLGSAFRATERRTVKPARQQFVRNAVTPG